jgi:hypothetical protein
MLDLLWRSMYMGCGPFTTQEDGERWEEYLLSIAQPEWIDVFLEIALDPPDDILSVQRGWDLQLQCYMEAVAVSYPFCALHKIAQAIQEDRTRGQVIGTLLGREYDEAPEWCSALLKRSHELSKADVLQLNEVLKVVGNSGARALLHQPGPRVRQDS